MTGEQLGVFALLVVALGLFAWGKWRHDVIAVAVLMVAAVAGLVDPAGTFAGFAHPAVITVAAVLIISRGLLNSGLIDAMARQMSRAGEKPLVQLSVLLVSVTLLSGFMNNIGALALLMPIAIRMARKAEVSPSLYLMPLAFGSLLGGLITQVGTPANIIVSAFRADTAAGQAFRMFDFAPVGVSIALAGVLFILILGWRLIPIRQGALSQEELFEIDDYTIELMVPEDSKAVGETLGFLVKSGGDGISVVGHVRGGQRFPAPSLRRKLVVDDSVIIQSGTEELQELLDATGLVLADSDKITADDLKSDEVGVIEATVVADSELVGRTASNLRMRSRYGINILAVSREGGRLRSGPGHTRLKAGDVLLLQGDRDSMLESLPALGCLPLAERGLRLGKARRMVGAVLIFGVAIAVAATGRLPVQTAFTSAAAIMVLTGFVPLRELYTSIDWPVIILLGAMIPVSAAFEKSGGATIIADAVLRLAASTPPWVTITLLLFATQLLSDIINNAAAALLMAPVALSVALGMGAHPDPFLMSIAVGASCSFTTPIGHQSNTLVMGPGGYRFGDYWRLGLPLTMIVVAVAVPVIMLVWPLGL